MTPSRDAEPRRKITFAGIPPNGHTNPNTVERAPHELTEYKRQLESPHTMMKKLTQSPAVILLAIIAIVVGYDAIGARERFIAPTTVATVNLGMVLENLDERSAKEADLNRMFDDLKDEAKPMQDALVALEEQINNEANPDPTKTVRWGQQTWEEMMIGWHDVAVALKQ